MYNNEDNEKDYGINWIGLFIKVIIFVMFILLAVWLVTKVFFSYSNKDLENDLSRMKIAAENYFTEDNLPQEVGKSKILTLNEMLSQKLVKSKTIDSCDKEQSYAKATKYEEYALIKVELICGNKKDTTTTKIDRNGNKTTVDDNKTTETKEEKKTDNSTKDSTDNKDTTKNDSKKNNSTKSDKTTSSSKNSKSNTSSSGNKKSNSASSNAANNAATGITTERKTLYYEHAKITYSRVTRKVAQYCKMTSGSHTYYTLANTDYNSYAKGNTFSHKLKVTNIPSNATSISVSNIDRFSSPSEYSTYINERNQNIIMWTGGNNNGGLTERDAENYRNHSATYGYTGEINIDKRTRIVTVTVHKTSTITSLRGSQVYMPIKFTLTYNALTSDCVVDAYNNRNNYSSYQITNIWTSTQDVESGVDYNNTKWSTSSILDGYKATGKKEYR